MQRKLTPIKAIRAKCLDCCAGDWREVKLCPIRDCPLYIYRFGKRPKGENQAEASAQSTDAASIPDTKRGVPYPQKELASFQGDGQNDQGIVFPLTPLPTP